MFLIVLSNVLTNVNPLFKQSNIVSKIPQKNPGNFRLIYDGSPCNLK